MFDLILDTAEEQFGKLEDRLVEKYSDSNMKIKKNEEFVKGPKKHKEIWKGLIYVQLP